MPFVNEKIVRLVHELLVHVTGFQKGEANYDICTEYVMSNIKYHKFLDVDSKKVTRAIDGLITKLKIHSEDEKASYLEKHVDKFLSLPAFEFRESGKTETHWGILQLLLCLSNSPLRSDYVPAPSVVKQKTEDNFDWYAYLMEGIEPYVQPSDDSSDEDYDLETETDLAKNVTFVPDEVKDENKVEIEHSEVEEVTEGSWFARNVVVEYWRQGQAVNTSEHPSATFNLDWEEQLSRNIDLYVTEPCVQMTEYQVVREALWLLLGAEKSFLFVATENSWRIRHNIQLTHITHSALQASLEEIIKYSCLVRTVHKFLEEKAESSDCYPQTYHAFKGALWDFQVSFQKFISAIERAIITQEQLGTLTAVMEALRPRLREYDTIQHILAHSVDVCAEDCHNAVRACSLLAAMFNLMTSCHVLSDDPSQLNLVLWLWMRSCKPYLDKIDRWLYEGVLYDPCQEFIIHINEDVEEESYWDKGFTLHCCSGSTQDGNRLEDFTPVFLVPVLQQLVVAGKSMNLLFRLGHVKQIYPGSHRRTLYASFVSSVEEYFGPHGEINPDSTNPKHSSLFNTDRQRNATTEIAPNAVFSEHIDQLLDLREMNDPLLRLNCERLVQRTATTHTDTVNSELDRVSRILGGLRLRPMTPIQLMLRQCLYSHISERCQAVCTSLLNVLKTEYQLFSYFEAVKRYYLLEAGDTMYDFLNDLFGKLRHREDWKDMSSLNVIFKSCLCERYPQDTDRLLVTIEEGEDKKPRDRIPIRALDSITLEFSVPWPVSAILNSKCMDVYNTVFRFLLMIKRAKYGLDELSFTELVRSRDLGATPTEDSSILDSSSRADYKSRDQLVHAMHMLRFKLLCFVNSLHNYIMTRIVHSTSIQFDTDLAEARDIDDVIKAHNHYVTTLYSRCLQHKESKFTKEIVIKVLNLAVRLSALWDQGIENLKSKQVSEVDGEFQRCVQFLSTFFNNVIKRGSFAHLEPLAFALDTSHGQRGNYGR